MAKCLIIICCILLLLKSFVSSQTSDHNIRQHKSHNRYIHNGNSKIIRTKSNEPKTDERSLASYGIDTGDEMVFDDSLPLAEFYDNTPSNRRKHITTTTGQPNRLIKSTKSRSVHSAFINVTINHRHSQNSNASSMKDRRTSLTSVNATTKREHTKSVKKARSQSIVPANATIRRHHVHVKNSSLNSHHKNLSSSKIIHVSANKTNAINAFLQKHSDLIVQRVKHNTTFNHATHAKIHHTRRKNYNKKTSANQRKAIRKNANNTNRENRKHKISKVPQTTKTPRNYVLVVAHQGDEEFLDILVSDYNKLIVSSTTEKYKINNATKTTHKYVNLKIPISRSNKNRRKIKTFAVVPTRKNKSKLNRTKRVNKGRTFQKRRRSKGLNIPSDDFLTLRRISQSVSTSVVPKHSNRVYRYFPRTLLSGIIDAEDTRRELIIKIGNGTETQTNKHKLDDKSNHLTTDTVKSTTIPATTLEISYSTIISETISPEILSTTTKTTPKTTTKTRTKTATKATTSESLIILPVTKAPPKPLTLKEKERQKEYEHETLFARILRFLYKKNTFKQYGFTASVRVNREAVANGCIINEESVLTVLFDYHIAIEKNLSVRVGQGSESQIQEVVSVIPYQVEAELDNSIVVILKVKYLFEFGKTVYEAQISSEKPKKKSIVATEWKYTNSPSEHLDIPLKLVNYNVGLARHTRCMNIFGDNYDKSKSFCILRPAKKNGDYCKDLLGTLLVKKNTRKVLGILVNRECNETAGFLKLSKVKEWIMYYTMLKHSDNMENSQLLV